MKLKSLFQRHTPYPAESVELIYPRLRSHWLFHAWTALVSVLAVTAIPMALMSSHDAWALAQLAGYWLHRIVDQHEPAWTVAVPTLLAMTAASALLHETTHLVTASCIGQVTARFSLFRFNPAVFWYGSMSRNRAVLTLVMPCVLWGILPLLLVGRLQPLVALILYVPIWQNLVGSRADLAQALYLIRCVPRAARIYCHPDGLAYRC
jgi:hypothetical protein